MLQFSTPDTKSMMLLDNIKLDNIKLDVPEAETHNDPHMTNIHEV